MTAKTNQDNAVPRRSPHEVMRLSRLGSFHQSRLSFMRVLLRRLKDDNWEFSKPTFDIDSTGVGYAIYQAKGPIRTYSLVAFSHNITPEERSDRVIATMWDATFTLFDGIPTHEDIERLRANVPLQEAGRILKSELSLSRANRSVRLWDYVVECLSQGKQPDRDRLCETGYLMRTTAVYGSGKLGASDREDIATRPECAAPFQIEMLSVFLTRAFVRDLIEHMAESKAKEKGKKTAAKLDDKLARLLGIGNSTGLGMAPFIINHPVLFNNWIAARESAIAKIRSLKKVENASISVFKDILARLQSATQVWSSSHPIQVAKNAQLREDLKKLSMRVEELDFSQFQPWNALFLWAEKSLSIEGQECLASLMLEPYGKLIDNLVGKMSDENGFFNIDGMMQVSQIKALLEKQYDWALEIDWDNKENTARAWYVSAEKLEPRLGERYLEPIEPFEQPLSPGRDAARLYQALKAEDNTRSIAQFLLKNSEHRHIVRRVQLSHFAPYSEIRDNTISNELVPIDMLRCKLSFFGAQSFDPRSDRWVRICMFAHAPYPEEIANMDAQFWPYPELEVLA